MYKVCEKLGANSDVDVKIEICAALKHTETLDMVVYRVGEKFTLEKEEKENLIYYGGSDACQGDSGGPL